MTDTADTLTQEIARVQQILERMVQTERWEAGPVSQILDGAHTALKTGLEPLMQRAVSQLSIIS